MSTVSQDNTTRHNLISKEIIHDLLSVSLSACDPQVEQKTDEEKQVIKETSKILYNLASFDRAKFYIPGETANVSQNREKFASWGGLIGLFGLSHFAKLNDVKVMLDIQNLLSAVELSDLNLAIDTIKSYQKLATSKENVAEQPKEISFCEYFYEHQNE